MTDVEKALSSGPCYLKDIYNQYMADFSTFGKLGFGYSYPAEKPFERLTMYVDLDYVVHIVHFVKDDIHEYALEINVSDPNEDYSYVFCKKLLKREWPNAKEFIIDVIKNVSGFVAKMRLAIVEYQDAIDIALDELGE